jgi:hypothetical protein
MRPLIQANLRHTHTEVPTRGILRFHMFEAFQLEGNKFSMSRMANLLESLRILIEHPVWQYNRVSASCPQQSGVKMHNGGCRY